jgi:hypothetical protein
MAITVGTQPFHGLVLIVEHRLDLARHAIHGDDHTAQFQRPGQLVLNRIFAVANRPGLRFHQLQRAQDQAQRGHRQQ